MRWLEPILFGVLTFGAGLGGCGGDDGRRTNDSDSGADASEEPNSGGTRASGGRSGRGGSTGGTTSPSGSGGASTGGAAGEASTGDADASTGDADASDATDGAPVAEGSLEGDAPLDSGGAEVGSDACTPENCCDASDPPCTAGWDDDCLNNNMDVSCCDPSDGIRISCSYSIAAYYEAEACVDACTGKSYGGDYCGDCLDDDDPPCDENDDWRSDCSTKVYCSDEGAGVRMSCESGNPYGGAVLVECVCDIDFVP